MPKLTRRQLIKTLGVGALAGVTSATYAGDCANWLSVEKSELRLPKWDADGFRVGLIADLHMNNKQEFERAQRAIALTMDEKPDLIVIGGDFVNTSQEPILDYIRKALEPLSGARCPSIGVLGNHDYGCTRPDLVVSTIKTTRLRLLRNETFETHGVTVAGVDDATEGKPDYEFFHAQKVSRSCLGVLHEPDFVDEMPGHVSLQLSGHTHGGQVCLPFGYAMHSPRGGRRYISGFFPHANVPLYVTRGVGTTGMDYRLFCRPEVSILTLREA